MTPIPKPEKVTFEKQILRWLLWSYFFLVIFEGALRKWMLPQMATPLLVVRDPLCILALLMGLRYVLRQAWALGFLAIGIISIPLALTLGHGNLYVALFGARVWILHFPLIFLFPAVFNREDIYRFARVTLLLAIPMTLLLAVQFYLPQSHFVNTGVGGEGTSVFSGAAGRHRASGTFSFTNGLSAFYALAGALLACLLIGTKRKVKWIWISAACLLLAMPLAISRTIAFSYMLTGVFTAMATGLSPRLIKNLLPGLIAILLIFAVVSQTTVFEDATDAFSARWEAATKSEGEGAGVSGVVQNRIIEYSLLSAFNGFLDLPVFGHGIGMGTNVGAMFLSGQRTFLLSEGAWGAILGELGPIFGLVLIGYRIALTWTMGTQSFGAIRRGNPLPWILGSVALISMFMGNPAQPTSLGFIVLSCGLMLAAFKSPRKHRRTTRPEAPQPQSTA